MGLREILGSCEIEADEEVYYSSFLYRHMYRERAPISKRLAHN
jgi:hypothetical protein